MKLLLDENLPQELKSDLASHQVSSVKEEGWISVKNGALLKLMIEAKFDALITFDRRLQYQQNFRTYPIAVIILIAKDNRLEILRTLMPQLNRLLKRSLKPGPHQLHLNR